MEERHARLQNFIHLSSSAILTLPTDTSPCAFMVQEGADHQIPMRPTFHRFYEQDVVKAFDNDALSTRWMLKQMKTYDTGKQIVIGIILRRRAFYTLRAARDQILLVGSYGLIVAEHGLNTLRFHCVF